jgi:hypothetical protein
LFPPSALQTDDPVAAGGHEEKQAGGKNKKGQRAAATSEELTPLGQHLASLPVDPRIGTLKRQREREQDGEKADESCTGVVDMTLQWYTNGMLVWYLHPTTPHGQLACGGGALVEIH